SKDGEVRPTWRERRAFRRTTKQETKRIKPTVAAAAQSIEKDLAELQEALDELPGGTLRCPRCRSRMAIRDRGNGPFWGCARYPMCRGTRDIARGEGDG